MAVALSSWAVDLASWPVAYRPLEAHEGVGDAQRGTRDEGLAITRANHVAVETGLGVETIAECSRIGLRVAVHGGHLAFELGRNVDHEGGWHCGVETGVEDPFRAVRGRFGVEALEAGKRTALFGQVARGRMVRMLGLPIGDDHQPRT